MLQRYRDNPGCPAALLEQLQYTAGCSAKLERSDITPSSLVQLSLKFGLQLIMPERLDGMVCLHVVDVKDYWEMVVETTKKLSDIISLSLQMLFPHPLKA